MSEAQLTIFTVPKAFEGHPAIIQWNAIKSWIELGAEVFLFGDDPGVAEVSAEVGARHFELVSKSKWGTPLLDGIFRQAQREAGNRFVCYANSDIIFFREIIHALQFVDDFEDFLLSGLRCNVDVRNKLEFEGPWETNLRNLAIETGSLYSLGGMDYFLFLRNTRITEMPPFAVGRPFWDNWLIFNAKEYKCPIIDATNYVMAVHQNHGYEHVPSKYGGNLWEGAEADINETLCDGKVLRLEDADYFLDHSGEFRQQDNADQIASSIMKLGNAYRKTNKKKALRYYLRSFRAQRNSASLVALLKLILPGYYKIRDY